MVAGWGQFLVANRIVLVFYIDPYPVERLNMKSWIEFKKKTVIRKFDERRKLSIQKRWKINDLTFIRKINKNFWFPTFFYIFSHSNYPSMEMVGFYSNEPIISRKKFNWPISSHIMIHFDKKPWNRNHWNDNKIQNRVFKLIMWLIREISWQNARIARCVLCAQSVRISHVSKLKNISVKCSWPYFKDFSLFFQVKSSPADRFFPLEISLVKNCKNDCDFFLFHASYKKCTGFFGADDFYWKFMSHYKQNIYCALQMQIFQRWI